MDQLKISDSAKQTFYTSAAITGILSNEKIMEEIADKFESGMESEAIAIIAVNIAKRTIEEERAINIAKRTIEKENKK